MTLDNLGGRSMIRTIFSSVLGFILMYIESMIVLKVKGETTIDFGGIQPFVNVWAMNFFLVFAILTQVTNWYGHKYGMKNIEEDNI